MANPIAALPKKRLSFAIPTGVAILLFLALLPGRVSAAVTVSSFTAQTNGSGVLLEWTTATELQNTGFNLLRSSSMGGAYTKIAGLIPTKNPPGSLLGASYSYTDSSVTSGQTFFYKLESVDFSGRKETFGPVSSSAGSSQSAVSATSTNTPVPPASATSTSVPAPLASQTPESTTVASSPSPTRTRTATVSSATALTSPSRVALAVPPSPDASQPYPLGAAKPTLASPSDPTPVLILVPKITEQSTSENDDAAVDDAANSQAQGDSRDIAYYAERLLRTGVFLTTGVLVFGSFVLGFFAIVFFLKPHLR